MLFTNTLALAIMAISGANAAASPQRPRPVVSRPQAPQFNVQTINCGSGAAPYCCSPANSNTADSAGGLANGGSGDQSGGTTCSKNILQCNAFVICCNNNGNGNNQGGDARQTCNAAVNALQGPVRFID